MTVLSPKHYRQAAALGILAALCLAVCIFGIIPATQHITSLQSQIQEQRRLLGGLQRFTAQKDDVERRSRQSTSASHNQIFLAGRTDAVRTANLQALLTRAARNEGLRIRSSRTLASTKHNGIRFLGVEVVMAASLAQIQNLVINLESRKPYLFVQRLQIGQPTARKINDSKLQVRIGVLGAVRQTEG